MPRRACLEARHPLETLIAQAEAYVEKLGADPLLTDALCKLQEGRSLLADWLEGGQKPEPARVLTIAEQFAVLRKRWPQATMERSPRENNGQLVTIPDFPLPEGYDRPTCTVYFHVPDGYPYLPPHDFYTSELRRADGNEPFMTRAMARHEDLAGNVPPAGTMIWFWRVKAWNIWQNDLKTYASVIGARLEKPNADRLIP